MRVFRIVPIVCFFTAAGVLMVLLPHAAIARVFEYGANVRQTILLMRWPRDVGEPFPAGSFGISETRTRLYAGIIARGISADFALESRAGFMSPQSGMISLTEGGGSILGKGMPLERWDLTAEHSDDQSFSMSTRIERLNIHWIVHDVDIVAGRQPVSLGTSHFVGVLDVLAPFAPGDLDATYKPGIDAVRIHRGIGMTGEAEVIAAGAKDPGGGALLGRYRIMVRGMDIEFVGGRFRRRGFGGFGWEGEVLESGVWGEFALFERKPDTEKRRGGWSRAAFSGVAGVDIDLPLDFKAGGALMFQDFGIRKPGELIEVRNEGPFSEGWAFLASAAYGIATLHRQLHPLVQGDLAGIVNLVDGSTLWQPRLTVSTGENSDLCVYGWIGTGGKPRVDGQSLSIKSEFGTLPDGGGFYARWFF